MTSITTSTTTPSAAVETVSNIAGAFQDKAIGQTSKWVQIVAMIGFPAAMVIWWMQAVQIPNENQNRDHKERLMSAHEKLINEHQKLGSEFIGLKDLLKEIRDDQRRGVWKEAEKAKP